MNKTNLIDFSDEKETFKEEKDESWIQFIVWRM